MSIKGEEVVINYLEMHGLKVEKIKEGNRKTPDFRVYKDNELIFYCEEKTIKQDDFEKLVNFESDDLVEVTDVEDNSHSKISTKINDAAKQFESINKEHKYPNILVINNEDTLLNINDLFETTTKYSLDENGKIIKMRNSIGRLEYRLHVIDLFLWFDKGRYINCITHNVSTYEYIKKYLPFCEKLCMTTNVFID